MGGRQFGRRRKGNSSGDKSKSRTVAETAQQQISEDLPGGSPPPDSEGHMPFGDSVTVLALLLGIVFVLIVPPLYAKLPLFILVCAGFVWLIFKSHWTHTWGTHAKVLIGSVTIVVLCVAAVPQFVQQWQSEHNDTAAAPDKSRMAPGLAPTEIYLECHQTAMPIVIPFESAAHVMALNKKQYINTNSSFFDIWNRDQPKGEKWPDDKLSKRRSIISVFLFTSVK
jgi:hypothetical protein